MTTRYKVFHNPCGQVRKKLHVILVRPEQGGNIGSTARAIKNMGILGKLIIVGSPAVLNDETRKMAKHAFDVVEAATFVSSLKEAKALLPLKTRLLASTARVGSPSRPHPSSAREVINAEALRLPQEKVELAFVFGPESDGLDNDEVALCDRVVTIPSSPEYRSLNLSQAVLIFCYEANEALNALELKSPVAEVEGQRQRLIDNLLSLAEEAGFILPGDPHKMKAKLGEIFTQLPCHIPEARTLHGLLDQVRRSLRRGMPDFKGRYRYEVSRLSDSGN